MAFARRLRHYIAVWDGASSFTGFLMKLSGSPTTPHPGRSLGFFRKGNWVWGSGETFLYLALVKNRWTGL